MRRRDLITILSGGVAAWALSAHAQQPADGMRRVGVLFGIGRDAEGQLRFAALQQRLRELGWVEGKNVRIDARWAAGNPDLARTHAAELVDLKPDVIVSTSTPATEALRQQTRSVPIVFLLVTDPVGAGFVTNLARPEANLTGFTNFELSMGGKWLEILKEIAPDVARVGLIFNSANSPAVRSYYGPSIDEATRKLGIASVDAPVRDDAEIERAIDAFAREANGGLVVLPDTTVAHFRDVVVSAVARHRLPAVYPYRYYATSGGLLSYGIDTVDLYLRAASYADRILRGAKTADLPVQQPTKFELVVNLNIANAIGVGIPPSLLARADEVIE